MKLLRFSSSFLTSKVARRIFLLFIFCIILPFLIIAIITNNSVSSQLYEQAQKKLKRTAKNKGFEIYNNLSLLENELKIIAIKFKNFLPDKTFNQNFSETETLREKYFIGIILFDRNDQKINIYKHIKKVPEFSSYEMEHMNQGKTLVKTLATANSYPAIFMSQKIGSEPSKTRILLAQINPVFLWGIGSNNTLPPEIEFMVHHKDNIFLISSLRHTKMNKTNLEKLHGSSSGSMTTYHNGSEYITSFWTLFIKPRFFIKSWTIITSQLKLSIYEPISNFKNNFFHFMILAFLVVILMSMILIRRNLVPIEILRDSTKKIAKGEFDIDVNIKSGDEFEILGKSFNEMSRKLEEGRKLLVQAAKMSAFGKISAGIVHEIGQPLTALSGLSKLLNSKESFEKNKERIQVFESELERLSQIIHKFRTITRSDDVVMTLIPINQVVYEVYALLEHQARMKKIDFLIKKTDDLPLILGDKDSLKQVFINLVINSMDALEPKLDKNPFIHISTFSKDGFVQAEVKDNGIGIPEDIQSEIFDPFFSTKSSEKGSGLGLAIIDSILHNHTARIEVESELGKGTCFKIFFPIPV